MAKSRSGISVVWDRMTVVDLRRERTGFSIPVHFFAGAHDDTCNTGLARDDFTRVQAPVKGFYAFEASAHSPMFEEPEKFRRILRGDVLAGANALADLR